MYKMATAGVPIGSILAVHLQKCSHLSNEIRVMIILEMPIYMTKKKKLKLELPPIN
jgi:hypothetical protein